MTSWYEDLETQLQEGVRDALWQGMRETVGNEYEPDLARVLAREPLRFIMVEGGEAVIVDFDGERTTATFLGSLAGGTYSESVAQDDGLVITGTYTHRRLAEPLAFTFEPRSTSRREHLARQTARRIEIDTELREKLRKWSLSREPAREQASQEG